jgi:diguanylate cyclase (GGDEF)-like protein/PAS domain S-box-containing protein
VESRTPAPSITAIIFYYEHEIRAAPAVSGTDPDNQGSPAREARRFTNNLRAWLRKMLGFDSIRGRYLLAAGLFMLVVLAAGWIAQTTVSQTAQQSSTNTTEREQIGRIILNLHDDIWLAESTLQSFLLTPDKHQRAAALDALAQLLLDIDTLLQTDWTRRDVGRKENIELIRQEITELRRQSELLMDIRADAEKLFPAMRHMLDKMLPNNIDFLTQATLALDEAASLSDTPARREAHRLFSEVRYAWSLMINAFRVFLANRFGIVPGDPEQGMKLQHDQILFYQEMIEGQLAQLGTMDARGQLEFQQSESLERMRRINHDWHQAYRNTRAIYASERWRADVPLLRDSIHPLFARIWVELGVLRNDLEAASAQDMTSLTGVASSLSRSLWLVAFSVAFLALGGFFFFEFAVRRPIARVAAGLKAEAYGLDTVALPQTRTVETRDLIDAFENMRRQVHSRQQRLQTILENTAEGIVTFDPHGTIESCNAAAKRLFGWVGQGAIGLNIRSVIESLEAPASGTYPDLFLSGRYEQLVGKEGEMTARRSHNVFPMAIKIGAMQLDGRPLYTALVADISERKAMVEHLRNLAEHDDLTRLYNRSFFLAELERVVERAQRGLQDCTLLYIDLDNFKYVNDTLGHLAGDRLLVELSEIFQHRVRRGDLVARLGGDEFTMLLYGTRADEARTIAESFRKELSDYQFQHDGEVVNIGCSIGATRITAATHSAQEALSHADFACHLAKRSGRNRIHVFEKQDEADVAAMSLDMGWSRRIKDAIRDNHFYLATQPIIDARTGRAGIHEVLIRLRDENGNIVMPGGFLSGAERFGLATDIDRWVIVNTIQALSRRRRFVPDLCYSINLSGQTLSQSDVAELIINELGRQKLDPTALIFEVTETAAIADMAMAVNFLGRLKTIGCRTALDDFGSGMSSFAYLRDLPVDYVKIDGRFVRNMVTSPVDQAMVRAMNDVAHALGKLTIAEFVENEACFRLLQEYGLDFVQGYHLGRPALLGGDDTATPTTDNKVVYLRPL